MTVPMRRNLGPADDERQGAAERNATPTPATRDQLALSHVQMDEQYPEALDLTAEVLEMLRDLLRGSMAQMSGTLTPNKFREALYGGRTFRLVDLCRLATSRHPQAKLAARSALRLIEREATARQAQTSVSLHDAALAALEHATAMVTEALRTSATAPIPDSEKLSILKRLNNARIHIDQTEAALYAHDAKHAPASTQDPFYRRERRA